MINIAELLKDCPKGMELDCAIYDNVTLVQVKEGYDYPIVIETPNGQMLLSKYGCFSKNELAKCIIFPKGKTTWEGFVPPCKFEDGDILFVKGAYSWVLIYKESENKEDLHKYVAIPIHPNHTYIVYDNNPLCCKEDVSEIRFATEEEKEKLFQAIKDNGYHWNAETKTLEKLDESKEDTDDRVVMSGIYFDRENYADEVELHLGNYEIEVRDGKTYAVFKNQKTNTFEKFPKFKDGDVIVNIYRKHLNGDSRSWKIYQITNDKYIFTDGSFIYIQDQNNWVLNTDKFDITTLKPFKSKVLVRNYESDYWKPATFGFAGKDKNAPFYVEGGNFFSKCIPYEGNEHLLGTTNDCNEYYK